MSEHSRRGDSQLRCEPGRSGREVRRAIQSGGSPSSSPPFRRLLGPKKYILVPLALTTLVHHSILNHYFIGDEFIHFYNLMNFGLLELLLTPHGGHLLVTSNSTYFLFYELFGFETGFYYAVVLLTHILNVSLLFGVIRVFTGSTFVAAMGSTIWGVSPINEGSVGWFAVYGHVLLGTWMLWVLHDVACISRNQAECSRWMLARWYMLMLAAATSFGFGLAMAMAFGPAVYLLLAGTDVRTRIAVRFSSLTIVIPGVYLTLQWLHHTLSGRAVAHGVSESIERSPWVLANWHIVPLAFLDYLSYGIASLPIGFLVASVNSSIVAGPLQGVSLETVMHICRGIALLCFIGVATAFYRTSAVRRSEGLGLALLVFACYGTIALWVGLSGRGTFAEAHGMPAVVHSMTARYHYVAPMLLVIIACLPFGESDRKVARRRSGFVLLSTSGALFAVLSANASRSFSLPDLRAAHEGTVARIQQIIDRAPWGSDVYIPNRPFPFWGIDQEDLFPGWAAIFVISYPENVVDGKRVYFVENDRGLRERATAARDTRIGRLLVSPEAMTGKGRR